MEPFPHFILDDVFDGPTRSSIDAHWPSRSLFAETGISGDGIFFLDSQLAPLPSDAQHFWSSLCHVIMRAIYEASFAKFAPFYGAKFGNIPPAE